MFAPYCLKLDMFRVHFDASEGTYLKFLLGKRKKTFVTHSCSQFSFSFNSSQTGTISGRHWGGGGEGAGF